VEAGLYLLLAHYLADFPLQGDFLANMKGKNWYLLMAHVLIYSLTIGAFMHALGIYATWKLFVVAISHVFVDYWKCNYAPKETALTTSLYIDQALHLIVLAICLKF
jgi:hypothetical protein